jgi:hypothetical protein
MVMRVFSPGAIVRGVLCIFGVPVIFWRCAKIAGTRFSTAFRRNCGKGNRDRFSARLMSAPVEIMLRDRDGPVQPAPQNPRADPQKLYSAAAYRDERISLASSMPSLLRFMHKRYWMVMKTNAQGS